MVRLFHVGSTGVTSALPANAKTVVNTANTQSPQPTLETQTYAPTSTPPDGMVAGAVMPTEQSVQVPRACTGSQYILPTPQDLSGTTSGLVKTIDQPTYYQIYGNSIAGLRSAITDCPYRQAAGSYHASTAYQLNWRYRAVAADNNQCTLTNIRVGLHINQLMPFFAPTASTPTSVAGDWNAYAANLTTHEAGHIDIDTQYATKILAALQAMGPLDCAQINHQAQTTIDSYVTMLNAANDLYDSRTNHGATQGAVL